MPAKERRKDPLRSPRIRQTQGKLLLIGGNEEKSGAMAVLRTLVAEAGGDRARIEVITTASSEPKLQWEAYDAAFQAIGAGHAEPMHIGTRAEASAPALVDRIAAATAVFFTGGDQLRITSMLAATPVAAAIHRHFFEQGRLVAGTSAGAAAMTSTIIYDGNAPESLHKGSVKMTGGLALISNAVVDTHFVSRGRFGRLIQVVAGNPRLIGVGIGEDTAVLATGGSHLSVVGTGQVVIVDGASLGFTNVFEVEDMEPFSVEGINVHVLSSGAGFDLETRSFRPPPPRPPKPAGGDGR